MVIQPFASKATEILVATSTGTESKQGLDEVLNSNEAAGKGKRSKQVTRNESAEEASINYANDDFTTTTVAKADTISMNVGTMEHVPMLKGIEDRTKRTAFPSLHKGERSKITQERGGFQPSDGNSRNENRSERVSNLKTIYRVVTKTHVTTTVVNDEEASIVTELTDATVAKTCVKSVASL